eukprot:COSAG06_NODE_724_length_12795_cov_16.058129_7_plen_158_part_00
MDCIDAPLEVHDAVVVRVRQNGVPRTTFQVRVVRAADLLLSGLVKLHLKVNRDEVLGVNLEDLLGSYLDELRVIDCAVFVLQHTSRAAGSACSGGGGGVEGGGAREGRLVRTSSISSSAFLTFSGWKPKFESSRMSLTPLTPSTDSHGKWRLKQSQR